MRILLDSRDLIDLAEHGRPIAIDDFNNYLQRGVHQNVLSFTNVRELASPLSSGRDFLEIRPLLQSLERCPHTYIKEVTIVAQEIKTAVNAFESGVEYQDCVVYVPRWDHTLMMLPGQQRSAAENFVNFRLDEIIYYTQREAPQVFAPPHRHLGALQQLLQQDRDALRAGRAPAREHFVRSIKKHAKSHRVLLPDGREDNFARWVYANPNRCPGLRLNHETYRGLIANYRDIPETGDFSDLAHVFAIPYVDAATLARRMRHYAIAASRKLVRIGATSNYGARIYSNLATLIQQNP